MRRKIAGVTTGTVVVELAKDGKFIKDWTYVDLSSLGQVNEVVFTMEGSDMSYGYLNTPPTSALITSVPICRRTM